MQNPTATPLLIDQLPPSDLVVDIVTIPNRAMSRRSRSPHLDGEECWRQCRERRVAGRRLSLQRQHLGHQRQTDRLLRFHRLRAAWPILHRDAGCALAARDALAPTASSCGPTSSTISSRRRRQNNTTPSASTLQATVPELHLGVALDTTPQHRQDQAVSR